MEQTKAERTVRVLKYAALILFIGAAYYGFVSLTGLYIPCLFRLVTGWKCPGCGVSHLFVELMHLRIGKAFSENPFVFLLLPPAAVYAAVKIFRYIKSGKRGYSKAENTVFLAVIAAAAVFTVLRNTIL